MNRTCQIRRSGLCIAFVYNVLSPKRALPLNVSLFLSFHWPNLLTCVLDLCSITREILFVPTNFMCQLVKIFVNRPLKFIICSLIKILLINHIHIFTFGRALSSVCVLGSLQARSYTCTLCRTVIHTLQLFTNVNLTWWEESFHGCQEAKDYLVS